MRTLEGITVVSIEQAVAAPFASRHLADLGARVIKVERPSGDFARQYDHTVNGLSSHFVWINRNKESLVLDLKDPEQLRVLTTILGGADVFLQNLAPGAVERLGIGPDQLRADNPRLITCSISGYGMDGPYETKKAYDLLVQCEAGAVSITGTEDEPAKAGIPIADIAAGTYAFSGILAALLKRERTGEGSHVEVSMLEALGEWMGYPMYYSVYGGAVPPRTGARHAAIAPYGPFATSDKPVFLAVQNDREWRVLATEVLRQPGLVEDERFATNSQRVTHVEELKAVIEEEFSRWKVAELEERLDQVKIANARLRTPQEFAEHPQLRARDRWTQVNTENGPIDALKPVFHIDHEPVRTEPVPSLGQHTQRILAEMAELEYSASEQNSL